MEINTQINIKDTLALEFSNLTGIQVSKLIEMYHLMVWVNPSINLDKFIIILKTDSHFINNALIFQTDERSN